MNVNYTAAEVSSAVASSFIPSQFKIEKWADVLPYFEDLYSREVNSERSLKNWLLDRSLLNSILEEDMAWRYIRMTCNTHDQEASERYRLFVESIEPEVSVWQNKLDLKLLSLPYFKTLDFPGFDIYRKFTQKDVEIFREENVPLMSQIQLKAQDYAAISGAMTIEWEGKELTLQQAAVQLQSTDRAIRQAVYEKIQSRRQQDAEQLQILFGELIALRHQVAQNAGFANFRDYSFAAMGRFDYTPEDCKNFHQAVEKAVVPLVTHLLEKRKEKMGLPSLRPYDLAVEESGKPPLKPFENGADLLLKSKKVFGLLHPFFGECLEKMEEMNHFDLESRIGKAPGGYNYPLDVSGFPFIFMNASSTLRDMVTMMHEGGHAVHSILTRFLPLNFFKHTSSEVAELASMSMELMSMSYWNYFFEDNENLNRAKKEHLSQIIDTLPWVATIDAFQHWLYENPQHSVNERTKAWLEISGRFSTQLVDFTGYEVFRATSWQKQLHLFEVPFYYIEYGMAQLGAIALWRNFKKDPNKAIENYMKALSLGHTAGIKTVYEAAGIRFDFSAEWITELMDFVWKELADLE